MSQGKKIINTESQPTFSKLFFEHKFWIHNMSGSEPLIQDSVDFSNGQKLILGNSRSSNSSLPISTRTGSLRKCFRLGAPKKIMKRDNSTNTKKSLLAFMVLMARLALQICIQLNEITKHLIKPSYRSMYIMTRPVLKSK